MPKLLFNYLTKTHTHRRRYPDCRCSIGWCAPNHDEVNTPFSPIPLAMNDRSVLHSNKHVGDAVFGIVLGVFRV